MSGPIGLSIGAIDAYLRRGVALSGSCRSEEYILDVSNQSMLIQYAGSFLSFLSPILETTAPHEIPARDALIVILDRVTRVLEAIRTFLQKSDAADQLLQTLLDIHTRIEFDHLITILEFDLELLRRNISTSSLVHNMNAQNLLNHLPPLEPFAMVRGMMNPPLGGPSAFATTGGVYKNEITQFWNLNFGVSRCVPYIHVAKALSDHRLWKAGGGTSLAGKDTGAGSAFSVAQDSLLTVALDSTISESVENFLAAASQPWFAGFLSRRTAHYILEGHAAGTFLIRFAGVDASALAISYVSDDGSPRSFLIERLSNPDLGGSTSSLPDTSLKYKLGAHSYVSLREMVEANCGILRLPHSYARFGLGRYFHGFIDFDEAERRLRASPIRSYLIRFSQSKKGSLVLAWSSSAGNKQTIAVTDYRTRELVLDSGKRYVNMEDIIANLSAMLQFPCPMSNYQELLSSLAISYIVLPPRAPSPPVPIASLSIDRYSSVTGGSSDRIALESKSSASVSDYVSPAAMHPTFGSGAVLTAGVAITSSVYPSGLPVTPASRSSDFVDEDHGFSTPTRLSHTSATGAAGIATATTSHHLTRTHSRYESTTPAATASITASLTGGMITPPQSLISSTRPFGLATAPPSTASITASSLYASPFLMAPTLPASLAVHAHESEYSTSPMGYPSMGIGLGKGPGFGPSSMPSMPAPDMLPPRPALPSRVSSMTVCGICLDGPPNNLLMPCSHPYCSNCANKFKASNECPLCRGRVSYVQVMRFDA